jgi:hypothetical protein
MLLHANISRYLLKQIEAYCYNAAGNQLTPAHSKHNQSSSRSFCRTQQGSSSHAVQLRHQPQLAAGMHILSIMQRPVCSSSTQQQQQVSAAGYAFFRFQCSGQETGHDSR